MIVVLFNWLVVILNTLTALVIAVILRSERVSAFPTSHKVGLWVGFLGLIGQAIRNLQFLFVGVSPTDNDIPFWVLKDAGYWIIAGVVVCRILGSRSENKN